MTRRTSGARGRARRRRASRSSPSTTTSAVHCASVAALPRAIETSACASAGASLMPSPTIATIAPRRCKRGDGRPLVLRRMAPRRQSAMPTGCATAADGGVGDRLRAAIRADAQPREARQPAAAASAERRRRARTARATPCARASQSLAASRPPPRPALGAARARDPIAAPEAMRARRRSFPRCRSREPRRRHWAAHGRRGADRERPMAIGCADPRSSAAASASTSAARRRAEDIDAGEPRRPGGQRAGLVEHDVRDARRASRAHRCARRIDRRRPSAPAAAASAAGVASDSAQGQDTTSTATATASARAGSIGRPDDRARRCEPSSDGDEPCRDRGRRAGDRGVVRRLPGRPGARSRASVVAPPAAVTRTTSGLSRLTDPAMTRRRDVRARGRLSPVRTASSTLESARDDTPSAGTGAPGATRMTSPLHKPRAGDDRPLRWLPG